MRDRDTLFLSCDWGTSSFRLRLVSAEGFRVMAETGSKRGISNVYEDWCKSGQRDAKRLDFYLAVIGEHLKELEARVGDSLQGIPLIISGMASSNIGMMELPYKQMPFALDGSDLKTQTIAPSDSFSLPVLVISGVCTEDDVMRGEEVQVVGCNIEPTEVEKLIIHPGTHCKHIWVKGDQAVCFRTYMTGEFFALLSTKSILAASVSGEGEFPKNKEHFEQGVRDAGKHELLHSSFLVRTGSLFQKRSREANYYYLSGLLIGSELNAFPKDFNGPLILAGEPALVQQYQSALDVCGIAARVQQVIVKEPDAITLAGQYAVYLNPKNP
jgi:2-dehydro-3-deoxygalactonokinase